MKLLVALLLFLFFNFNFQKCYSRVAKASSGEAATNICFSCKDEGQTCTPSSLNGFGDCKNDLVCGTDTNDPELQRYICQQPSLDGCVDSTVCDVGLLCDFSESQRCSDIRFAGIGETCVKDLDCSGKDVKCQDGICKSNNLECLTHLDCKGGETCNPDNGKCISSIQLGGECKKDYECGSLSFCSKFTNKCSLINSVADGEKCDDNAQCHTGSTCSSSGLCSQGVLISSSEDKFSNCSISTDSTCEFGSYCDCVSGLCKLHPKHPKQIYIDRLTCIKNNNCQVVDNLYSKSSCFTKYCKDVEIESFKDNICKNTIFDINYRNIEQQETGTSTFLHINAILLSTIFIFAFLINYEI